jgi:hypothetical protein
VRLCATAQEVWVKLAQVFDSCAPANIMAENAKLLALVMRDDEDILAWSTRVRQASKKFIDMGGDFTDQQQVMLLLTGLPPAFRSPRHTLLNDARKASSSTISNIVSGNQHFSSAGTAMSATSTSSNHLLWYERFGHRDLQSLAKTEEDSRRNGAQGQGPRNHNLWRL